MPSTRCFGARRQRGEQPERAVHVEPRAVPLGELGHVGERIEVAGVHLAGAADHDRGRAVELAQRRLHRLEVDPADVVARQLRTASPADPEHAERLDVARVGVAAAEHRDRRGPGEPRVVDIHARALAHQRRAHASATKFAIVAPVVSTPPHAAGKPNSSFSHSIATCSSRPPRGVEIQAPGFWSSVGGQPVRARAPPASSRRPRSGRTSGPRSAPRRRARRAVPRSLRPRRRRCSGSGPAELAATSSARGSRTGRSAIPPGTRPPRAR